MDDSSLFEITVPGRWQLKGLGLQETQENHKCMSFEQSNKDGKQYVCSNGYKGHSEQVPRSREARGSTHSAVTPKVPECTHRQEVSSLYIL